MTNGGAGHEDQYTERRSRRQASITAGDRSYRHVVMARRWCRSPESILTLSLGGSSDRTSDVNDFEATVSRLSTEKALALAAYGESVAAYRYRTLCEKAAAKAHRKVFEEMADEEQDHHAIIQKLLRQQFPDSDFVLTPEDKDLVIVGPRLIEVTDTASFDRALEMIRASECLTGRFYAALHESTTHTELKPMLKEMADECREHAERLDQLPR